MLISQKVLECYWKSFYGLLWLLFNVIFERFKYWIICPVSNDYTYYPYMTKYKLPKWNLQHGLENFSDIYWDIFRTFDICLLEHIIFDWLGTLSHSAVMLTLDRLKKVSHAFMLISQKVLKCYIETVSMVSWWMLLFNMVSIGFWTMF